MFLAKLRRLRRTIRSLAKSINVDVDAAFQNRSLGLLLPSCLRVAGLVFAAACSCGFRVAPEHVGNLLGQDGLGDVWQRKAMQRSMPTGPETKSVNCCGNLACKKLDENSAIIEDCQLASCMACFGQAHPKEFDCARHLEKEAGSRPYYQKIRGCDHIMYGSCVYGFNCYRSGSCVALQLSNFSLATTCMETEAWGLSVQWALPNGCAAASALPIQYAI